MDTKLPLLSLILLPAALHAAVVTAPSSPNSGLFNWAPAGTATQSTTDFGGDAVRGNDGNTNGIYGGASVTHTDTTTPSNSWQVDLGADRIIDEIVLWNRADCCADRLSNFTLSVTNAAAATVYSQTFYAGVGSVGVSELVTTFGAAGGTISGKVVKVQLNGLNNSSNGGPPDASLSLAEVQVHDLRTPLFSNVAVGSAATQSTTGFGGDASRAVDGNTSGEFGLNTVTHTDDQVALGSPVFWETSLGGDFQINEVALWNRTDCCGQRLGNFRLSIFNDTTEVFGANYFVGTGNALATFSVFEDSGGFFATGDRVRVQYIDGHNNDLGGVPSSVSLSLAEVQVFGVAIPEPSAALALFGGAALLVTRRRR